MDHPQLKIIRHLIRPTRGGAAAVLIVFAFLLYIAANGGLMGIPLAFIITSWFFKYAYILFDHTVRGFDEPPTLDIQMLNPLDEQRPLAQVRSRSTDSAAVVATGTTLRAAWVNGTSSKAANRQQARISAPVQALSSGRL